MPRQRDDACECGLLSLESPRPCCFTANIKANPQALDKARIQWALGDIIENRPALSRWHPSYAARYEDFIESRQGLAARSRSRGRAPLDRIPDVPSEREQYRFQQ